MISQLLLLNQTLKRQNNYHFDPKTGPKIKTGSHGIMPSEKGKLQTLVISHSTEATRTSVTGSLSSMLLHLKPTWIQQKEGSAPLAHVGAS